MLCGKTKITNAWARLIVRSIIETGYPYFKTALLLARSVKKKVFLMLFKDVLLE